MYTRKYACVSIGAKLRAFCTRNEAFDSVTVDFLNLRGIRPDHGQTWVGKKKGSRVEGNGVEKLHWRVDMRKLRAREGIVWRDFLETLYN